MSMRMIIKSLILIFVASNFCAKVSTIRSPKCECGKPELTYKSGGVYYPQTHPWMVLVKTKFYSLSKKNSGRSKERYCTGIIISPGHVLTDSECVSKPPKNLRQLKIKIYAGKNKIRLINSNSAQKTSSTIKMRRPQFALINEGRFAIIKLIASFRPSESIMPICIDDWQNFDHNQSAIVSSWIRHERFPNDRREDDVKYFDIFDYNLNTTEVDLQNSSQISIDQDDLNKKQFKDGSLMIYLHKYRWHLMAFASRNSFQAQTITPNSLEMAINEMSSDDFEMWKERIAECSA